MTADVSVEESERSPEQHARWLLAQLLAWHRREDKSTWWAFFTRRAMTPEDLNDDHECLGDLTYEGVERPATRFSDVLRFAFPKQEHKITPGNYVDPQTGAGVEIVDIDDDRGLVFIQRRRGRTDRPRAVIPGGPYDTTRTRMRCSASPSGPSPTAWTPTSCPTGRLAICCSATRPV